MAFSTLNLHEGLKTLSVLQWLPVYIILGAIPILFIPYLLVFTKFWILSLLALSWLAYDWDTHNQGGRRSSWVRNWTLWKYFQTYFPVKLVKTHDLPPDHNYVFVCHPHGVLSHGVFVNFATEATNFSQIFPAITPSIGTLEGFFWIPFVREYVMALGVCPVSESSLRYFLTYKKSGNAAVLVPGGAAESLLGQPGSSTILLKNRKGFVKLALKTGAYLVPCYSFGENDVYNQETFPEGTWKRFFQKAVQNTLKIFLGLNFCTFHGQGLTQGSWGLLPFNRPITTVVGEPMPMPRINDPDQKTVDKYHELYVSALKKLFNEHKVQYGLPETQELIML
ncbi:diacylglycerol O-acyltransferase 2-like protein 6 [Suncus etruscus]|uniref:diacylglycerol O-acyltransferase 2-like protein 6 n=1 Tax=Suncus etruscus TaxID=109475 RepID=UPI002110A6BC|nr:diacylglycerol O-acyltransferase 2-like protein 6 [Suncus etruscus]